MKIFVIKHTFFTNSYRCTTVRERCLKYANELRPDIIVITGMAMPDDEAVRQFVARLHNKTTLILREKQVAEVDGIYVQVEHDSCLIHNKVIKTQPGMMTIVEIENNVIRVKTLVLDIFSDETFAHYHSDLSDQDIIALSQVLKHK